MPCCVMLCCEECPATDDTIPNWNSEINATFNSVTLARTIWLPDDDPRTETCRSVFNVLMCKFYKFIYVQWLV